MWQSGHQQVSGPGERKKKQEAVDLAQRAFFSMPPLIKTLAWAVEMAQWVKTLTKSNDLSMISGTDRVGRQNRLFQVAL